MNLNKADIPYPETGYFSKTVTDYLCGHEALRPFYGRMPEASQLEAQIHSRKEYATPRKLLVKALQEQYGELTLPDAVQMNLNLLLSEKTFTITTAHQPNIFTGPLYFIYKILHAVRLAAFCKEQFPDYNFVPVYYMGSEDADIEELGHIYLNREKLEWKTNQTGAVGRMLVDEELTDLINQIASQIGGTVFGPELISSLKACYRKGRRLQEATRDFVHELFGRFGLVVLIPDDALLKKAGLELFIDELLEQRSSGLVQETADLLTDQGYKAQTHGRAINLFYLTDDYRQRIEKQDTRWRVVGTDLSFDQAGLIEDIQTHPEKISPNVILRGLFQEMILPNLMFIGGGGELAYWLELKSVFEQYKIPYPILILRNSFLLVNVKQTERMKNLGFTSADLFQPLKDLEKQWVQVHGQHDISVEKALTEMELLYAKLEKQAKQVSDTLPTHVRALQKKSFDRIRQLGKKLLRAEKRNHSDAMRQIHQLKNQLFPFGSLQERIDNFSAYYAQYGPRLLDILYENSPALDGAFTVLELH
ncbi:bacillithiol biosynthesis cysteine-adding enzyme BshC [Niabella terrae]